MNRTIIIRADDTVEQQDWPTGSPSLEWLQKAVGGYIETVPFWNTYDDDGTTRGCVAYCNEEGKLDGLPANRLANQKWDEALKRRFPDAGQRLDYLVGTIVVLVGDRRFRES